MTKTLTTLCLLMTIASCSQINTDSREYYKKTKSPPHGIKAIKEPEKPGINEQILIDLKASSRGKKIYEKNCIGCHGPKGLGNGELATELLIKPRNLVDIVRATPNFKFYISISKWEGKMPGWWWSGKELTHQDLMDLTNYLKLMAKK